MTKLKLLSIAIVILAFMSSISMFGVPYPPDSEYSTHRYYSYLVVNAAVVVLFIGASIVFIAGWGEFTTRLKKAYTILCSGLTLYGLSQFQIPLLLILNQLDSFWAQYGFIILPFLTGVILLYLGLRSFAHILEIKSTWTSVWRTILVAIGLAILSSFIPHIALPMPEIAFDISVGLVVFGSWLTAAAAILAFKIKLVAGIVYANPMAWLVLAFMTLLVLGGHYVVTQATISEDHWYRQSATDLAMYIVAGLFFIRSGYGFSTLLSQKNLVDTGERNFFGRPRQPRIASLASSPIDVVVYTANLVSNRGAIDPILDHLRQVTANIASGQALSQHDLAQLKETYLEIESYLVEKERVRKFEQSALRSHIQATLHLKAPPPEVFETFSQPTAPIT
jgi:hypothetical protein